jgi:predicted kinase
MIVIVFGLPGSGKSYFASRLAKRLNAEYINSDLTRKKMFKSRTYVTREKSAVYDRMFEEMQVAIRQNRPVVIDGTFHKQDKRELFKTAAGPGQPIFFMEIWAREELTRERLSHPRPDSEADFAVYQLIQGEWDPYDGPYLRLESTNANIDAMLASALKYIQGSHD